MRNISQKELEAFQQKADSMKQAVLDTGNLDPAEFTGTVYYVSQEGSDLSDGKTPETAVQSLERVKALPLKPGDAVLFRRGGLFRGHSFAVPDGVTVSAWGSGIKPTLCGSMQNYADPALWKATEYKGIWACTVPLKNVGLITFDHDPRTAGKYDVLCGWLVAPVVDFGDHSTYTFPDPPPLQLKNDLEFWTDSKKQILYLRSDENPGIRFHEIEIAPEYHGIQCCYGNNVTIDNLHVTLMGRHGISCVDSCNFQVTNCVLDYIGGSILWEQYTFNGKEMRNVRFGNAVEAYSGCSGFRVCNNWIYQIYDTGVSHQCQNRHNRDIIQENVEYAGNLIEYCYWSIEYYNRCNRRSITRNIYVHDNFCRFGGQGWGCRLRKQTTPMYSISFDAETENYVTENNIFQSSEGNIIHLYGSKTDPDGFIFRRNTYIQAEGGIFADNAYGGKVSLKIMHSGTEPEIFVRQMFHEEDGTFYMTKQ